MNRTTLMPSHPLVWEGFSLLQVRSRLPFVAYCLLVLLAGCPETEDTPEVLVERGNLLRDEGRFSEASAVYRDAIEGFQEYLKDSPQDAYVWYRLASLYLELGEFSQAVEGFEKAMEYSTEYSEDAMAWYRLATAYFNLDQKDQSLEAFNMSIRLNPQDAVAFNDRGWLMQTAFADNDAAMHDYTEAIRIDPKDPVPVVNRALLHKEASDLQLALSDMNLAIQIDPEHAGNFHERAEIQYELGQKDAAIDDFSQAIALDNEFADAYLGRGIVRRELGRDTEAEADFQTALRLSPGLTIPPVNSSSGSAPEGIALADAVVMSYLEQQGYSQLDADADGPLRVRGNRDGQAVAILVATAGAEGRIRVMDSELAAIRESAVPVDLVVVTSAESPATQEVVKIVRNWTPLESELRPVQFEVSIP